MWLLCTYWMDVSSVRTGLSVCQNPHDERPLMEFFTIYDIPVAPVMMASCIAFYSYPATAIIPIFFYFSICCNNYTMYHVCLPIWFNNVFNIPCDFLYCSSIPYQQFLLAIFFKVWNVLLQPFDLADNTSYNLPRYKFVFSNVEDEKDAMTALVMRLGGSTSEEVTQDTTHLVSGKLSRSERHLTAIAAGKWVLSPSYLHACARQGAFVEVT